MTLLLNLAIFALILIPVMLIAADAGLARESQRQRTASMYEDMAASYERMADDFEGWGNTDTAQEYRARAVALRGGQ